MSRYNSDALDEACEEMLGHTNWAYGRNPNEEKIDCVVFFYKDKAHTKIPLPEDRDDHEEEIDRLKTIIKSRDKMLNKINAWLVDECVRHDELVKRVENGEHAIDICDDPEVFYGRNECASSLLLQIKKWEEK